MLRMKPAPAVDRRSFLFRAMQLAAVPAFPALLVGCGGGSDDNTNSGVGSTATTITGQVVMPSRLSLAGTRVNHLLGDVPVRDAGDFRIGFVADSAVPTMVVDATGNLLLFGYLRAGQTTLSVRSTAEALVFRALGMWAHAGDVQLAALTLLASEDLTTVTAAVDAVIAAHGSTWTAFAATSGVGTAVLAKVAAMGGNLPLRAPTRKVAQGMIVTPTERVSGLIVDGDGIGAVTVENDFRRRALLAHTEVSAKLEGSATEFDLPEHLIETEMSPTDGLSSPLQSLADLLAGKTSYKPVTVTLATPRFPDTAVYTRYKIYAAGPGSALGDWHDMPQSVKDDGLLLIFKSVVLDFAVPFLASVVIPIKADEINKARGFAYADGAIKDLILLLAKIPELSTKLLAGDFKGCCTDTVDYVLHNTDSNQVLLTAAFGRVLELLFGASIIVDPITDRTVVFRDFVHDWWKKFDDAFDVGELAFTLFDTAVQACDIASSFMGEIWDVTVTKAKVSMSPLEFFVEKNGQFAGITARAVDVESVEGMVLGYSWKCQAGKLFVDGKYGTVIDSTTSGVVGYDALDVSPGTIDQIDVNVFLSGFGRDDPVGSAKCKVYVTGVTVSPTEKKLKANETVTLTAQTVGMRPLVAGETVVWKWTMNSSAGVLTADQTATASFRADATQEGLAFVTVEAFLGDKRIGMAQSTITVGTKLIVTGRVFEDHWKDASGCHSGMYIAFPKVKGATSYDVFVTGMRGPVFGTENHWSVFVGSTGAVGPFPWTDQGSEILGGSPRGYAILGGGNGGGDECVATVDQRWAAWYEGSKVEVTVTL